MDKLSKIILEIALLVLIYIGIDTLYQYISSSFDVKYSAIYSIIMWVIFLRVERRL